MLRFISAQFDMADIDRDRYNDPPGDDLPQEDYSYTLEAIYEADKQELGRFKTIPEAVEAFNQNKAKILSSPELVKVVINSVVTEHGHGVWPTDREDVSSEEYDVLWERKSMRPNISQEPPSFNN